MTFWAAAEPPMVVDVTPAPIRMPFAVFGTAAVPAAFRPM
jgi:hypothetical protein